jgi:hypothetical protein
LRMKVFHPCDGGPRRRTKYLATVDWAISMPSLSNSPWIPGAPHSGFSRLIRRTRLRTLADRAGRPTRCSDFQRQNRRKPRRCQRSRVSGRKGREQPVEADEDQTICGLQPRSGRRRPLQDNELLPQVEDLSLSSGLRAPQPRQQRRKKSQNMDHSAKNISDWKAVDRLDKFFSSHSSTKRSQIRAHRFPEFPNGELLRYRPGGRYWDQMPPKWLRLYDLPYGALGEYRHEEE